MPETFAVEPRGIGRPDYSVVPSIYGTSVESENPLPVEVAFNIKDAITVLDEASIAATATTALADCENINLRSVTPSLAITVEATYDAAATLGIRVHVRSGYRGVLDTEDWDTWDAAFTAGESIRQTKSYDADPMFLKVLIENLDAAKAVTNVKVIATLVILRRRPPCDSYGDIDGDGYVTQKDLSLLSEFVAMTRIPTDEEFRRADVNGDGAVNVFDITTMEMFLERRIDTFPACGA